MHGGWCVALDTSDMNEAEKVETPRRIAGVIVTHGQLATELLAAAEMIIGPVAQVAAISIGWNDDVDEARAEIERAIARVSEGHGVLILTDMFGGTPTNIASMFFVEGEVEVVTGVNLPMVIKLASQTDAEPLAVVAGRVRDQGQQAIHLAGELLAAPKKK
ncbi:MAG: mannose system component [Pyrinomonadaceae bacterium]|nr:mannose system component [Pyrinomonadaceae bacterium]